MSIQSRPFGVALLFGGVDEKGPQLYVKNLKLQTFVKFNSPLINNSHRFNHYVLYECRYHMDPSGTFVQCDARAIGSASEGAQSSLQEVYHKVQNAAYLNRKTL